MKQLYDFKCFPSTMTIENLKDTRISNGSVSKNLNR